MANITVGESGRGTMAAPAAAIHYDMQLIEGHDPFDSLHWMAYRMADGRIYIDLTGIALLALKGGDGSWIRKTLRLVLNGAKTKPLLGLPAPHQGYHWEVQPTMWSLSAAPAAVLDVGTAVSAGWAVDTCNTGWDLGDPTSTGDLIGSIPLYLNLGVSDKDAILYRISFDFRAIGTLREVRDVIVP